MTATGSLPVSGPMNMATYSGLLNDELAELYKRAPVELQDVAGTNTITATTSPSNPSYASGQSVWLTPAATNTGPVTLNRDNLGAVPVVTAAGVALTGGELLTTTTYILQYDGTNFRIIGTAAGGAQSVATRTALKALNPASVSVVVLTESGREGTFIWTAANLSSQVTADSQEGVYIASDNDPTGATGAWVREGEWETEGLDAHWFGAVGDGSTNDSTAINGAISLAGIVPTGVNFRQLEYAISATIVIGDGSSSQYSTINGVSLVGDGAPFLRLENAGGPLEDNGTRFKWTGAAGGVMVQIDGPCQGNDVRNIALNCDSLAAAGLQITSGNRGKFPYVTIASPQSNGTALNLDCVDAESIGGQTEAISTEGNQFDNLRLNLTNTDTIGINLDGYLGSATNGNDTLRNTFNNTFIVATLDGSKCVRIAYADQNTFSNIFISSFGVSNGNEAAIEFVGVSTVPGTFVFPQTNSFVESVDLGQNLPVNISGTGVLGPGNNISGRTFLDQQEYLRGDIGKYVRSSGVEPGNFPKGGFWGQSGFNIHERGYAKNRLCNPTFRHATIGTSRTNPPAGSTTIDGVFVTYDGTLSSTISRQDFTPGQTEVPYEPKHYLRFDVTAASTQTFMILFWPMAGVETFEGRAASFTAWMKASSAQTVGSRVTQLFGSGGSPSTDVEFDGSSNSVGTAWAPYTWTFSMASISGKTLGTNGDDGIRAFLVLPVNTVATYDIALPQFVAGHHTVPFEVPPFEAEKRECMHFVRKVGAGLSGSWGSTTNATLALPLEPPMFKDPTVSADGSSVTMDTPSVSTYTATATIASTANLTRRGGSVEIGGFTGAVANNPVQCRDDFIILQAYP